jgi:CMP-N-acetylneuraminic acid synthetase
MEKLITICARGGSKGIPGKNIKPINGIELIGYTIQHAFSLSQKINADITLSTDCLKIKNIASKFGLHTNYIRPENLSGDGVGKIETIKHLLEFEESNHAKTYEFIFDLDVSSPLRNIQDLLNAFDIIKQNNGAQNLFSVNKANRNPYFNMVEKNKNGYYSLVKKGNFLARQSTPEVFELNASFYIYKRNFFNNPFPYTIGEKSLIYEMPHICFDVDHSIDFDFMEYLIVQNKLGFLL